ncbi:MAG: histone deacetylase [Gammaproteobacteria bacterium]|nr:MAG: histone deacetylase [Gammaproteobacteria bacterium]
MNIYYHPNYNISLGVLNYLHPFDGLKFKKVVKAIGDLPSVNIVEPLKPISSEQILVSASGLMKRALNGNKRVILQALEIPYIPLLPFSVIDKRILLPMRWGSGGTLKASIDALENNSICWNLSGGYHHASQHSAQGFCIYNDIGITYEELINQGRISSSDKILIIDIDAHHGNGNARWFCENKQVTLLDIYNDDIYPKTFSSKQRVDISVPLKNGTGGVEYLNSLKLALAKLKTDFKLAFVVAGTDVLSTDPLGGLKLTIEESVKRDQLVFDFLKQANISSVFVGGGGYSKDSSKAIIESIKNLSQSA